MTEEITDPKWRKHQTSCHVWPNLEMGPILAWCCLPHVSTALIFSWGPWPGYATSQKNQLSNNIIYPHAVLSYLSPNSSTVKKYRLQTETEGLRIRNLHARVVVSAPSWKLYRAEKFSLTDALLTQCKSLLQETKTIMRKSERHEVMKWKLC